MFRLQEKDRAIQCGGLKGHSDVALELCRLRGRMLIDVDTVKQVIGNGKLRVKIIMKKEDESYLPCYQSLWHTCRGNSLTLIP